MVERPQEDPGRRHRFGSARANCTITFWDTNKKPVLVVVLQDAWPSKWSASDLSIQKSILWVETVVFQCESVQFEWL